MAMNTATDLEQQLLGLPPAERARLLLKAWESLADDPNVPIDPEIDPQGLKMAIERDAEISAGTISAIDELEFRSRTGADG